MMQLKALAWLLSLFLAGQVLAQEYQPPRNEFGRPDFNGYWSNASLTTMQRPGNFEYLVIPQGQIADLTGDHPQNVRQATDDGLVPGELLDGSDLDQGRGYNAFWVDPGSEYGLVKGERRTSWIVDPPDGRIPFSEQGQSLRREARGLFFSNDGPEGRSLGERCIIGFGSTGGPPMVNVLYNNVYQFVQTEDYLVIIVEMVHDARIIPLNGAHRPAALGQWLGDSVGHWEGDTLVVETRNLHPQQAPRNGAPLSEQGKVIERFTRYSDEQILYEFAVDDPAYYSSTWRGEMSFNASAERQYEYACHEGNYGLEGILAGARRDEVLGNVE
jgi:hypothetical protein